MALSAWTEGYEGTPTGSQSINIVDDQIRGAKLRVRERMQKEHRTWSDTALADSADTNLTQGQHLHGSAVCYFGDSSPTSKPDGTALAGAQDRGRLFVDSTYSGTDGYELKFYSDTGSWHSLEVFSSTATFRNGIRIGASTDTSSFTIGTGTFAGGFIGFDGSDEVSGMSGSPLDTTSPEITFPSGVKVLPHADGDGDIGTDTQRWEHIYGDEVWGAVGNDFADEIPHGGESDFQGEPGRVYVSRGGTLRLAERMAERGVIGICTDTASVIAADKRISGEKIKIAVAGFPLAFVDNAGYPEGTPLVAGAGGILTRAPWWVRVFHPERIVAEFVRFIPGVFHGGTPTRGRSLVKVR